MLHAVQRAYLYTENTPKVIAVLAVAVPGRSGHPNPVEIYITGPVKYTMNTPWYGAVQHNCAFRTFERWLDWSRVYLLSTPIIEPFLTERNKSSIQTDKKHLWKWKRIAARSMRGVDRATSLDPNA